MMRGIGRGPPSHGRGGSTPGLSHQACAGWGLVGSHGPLACHEEGVGCGSHPVPVPARAALSQDGCRCGCCRGLIAYGLHQGGSGLSRRY